MTTLITSLSKKIAASPLLVSFILFLLMLCVCSPLLYHGDNPTFCHALYLNDTASPHWLHPSYLLSYPLSKLAPLVPGVNVYLLYLYALLVCSAAAVLQVTRAREESRETGFTLHVAGLLVACYIIFFVPICMEYTWISLLAAGCGCMLVFHHLYRGETHLRSLLPGLLLFASGAVLRFDTCLGCAPFIGVASLFCLQRNRTPMGNLLRLAIPAGALSLLLAVYTLQPLPAEKQWQDDGNVVDINMTRISFYDYADRSGVDKTGQYLAAGVPVSYIRVLEDYFCCDESVMSTARWENIARIRRAGNPLYQWGDSSRQYTKYILARCHNRFLVIILAALWGILIRRGVWRLYPLTLVCAYFLCIILCCAKERCYLPAIMSLAYFYIPMLLIPCGVRDKRPGRISPRLEAYGARAAALLLIAAILGTHAQQLQPFGGFRHRYAQPAARQALADWLQAHPDKLALADCYVYRALSYPDAPLFCPKAPYLPRLIELGNWPSTLPYRHLHRERHGLSNEALALADPRARLVVGPEGFDYLEALLAHLSEHYGQKLVPEKECDLDENYAIYKFSAD